MSLLQGLNIIANPIHQAKTPIEQRRNKLIQKLQEQQSMAEAELGGNPYARLRWVTVPNVDGEPVRVQRPVRIKRWWQKSAAGQIVMTIRYGARVITIANGKAAIEIKSKDDLPNIIQTVIKAVDAGELDTQLTEIAASRRVGVPKVGNKALVKM